MQNFFLPDGYVSRADPQPFDDSTTADEWQPGAYALAFELMQRRGLADVVDIGAGNARKLRRFHDAGARVRVYDTPATVERLRAEAPWLKAEPVDLDSNSAVLNADNGALLVCCDVIEHLRAPGHLLLLLATMRVMGFPLVISTPDRNLAGCAPLGPPFNQSHAREWSMAEFQQLCAFYGLEGGDWSHTQTVNTSPACSTITGVFV